MNVTKAFAFFKESAQQDFAPAQYELGNCYLYGNDVNKMKQAYKWYAKVLKMVMEKLKVY